MHTNRDDCKTVIISLTIIVLYQENLSVSVLVVAQPAGSCPPASVSLLQFLDVASLQEPSEPLRGLCIYDVVWLRGAGASPDSTTPCLRLNATLRWQYRTELVRHFRVYWRRLRGPDPRIPPGQRILVGRAHSNLFRVTELAVPEPPSLLELVVEPVMKNSFSVPESHWGRSSLSYTEDGTH